MGRLTTAEWTRKIGHMGFGLVAFGFPFLGNRAPWLTIVLGLLAGGTNWFLLRNGVLRPLLRPGERSGGMGLWAYPFSIALLGMFLFRWPVALGAVWLTVAFGDGASTLFGRIWGRRLLPWNENKTWAGLLGFLFAGSVAVASFLHHPAWNLGTYEIWLTTLLGVGFAGWVESLPLGLDDNISVPFAAALVFPLLLTGPFGTIGTPVFSGEGSFEPSPGFALELTLAVTVCLLLALVGRWLGGLSASGALAGVVVGTLVWSGVGRMGLLLLGLFFALGTVATRFGRLRKAELGVAEERGGRRSARKVLANTLVAAGCSLVFAWRPDLLGLPYAFAGAVAAACADTLASELGVLSRRPPRSIVSWRRVAPGANGGVSLEGTLAALAGSGAVAGAAVASGLIAPEHLWAVALAGWVACLGESVVGELMENRGWLDNEAVNFLNTLLGAWLGYRVFSASLLL